MGFNSAPIFVHFPEKGKPKKGDNMDIQRVGFQAEVSSPLLEILSFVYLTVQFFGYSLDSFILQ